jgi:hypothetical protein
MRPVDDGVGAVSVVVSVVAARDDAVSARARRGLERVSTITRANRARFARRRVGRRDDDGSCTSAGWCF